MQTELANNRPNIWESIAFNFARWTGSSTAFLAALSLTAGWLVCGPYFHFSSEWQLVMNTASSIVTFIMVFLLQRSQNKDSLAMQLKLNELIASLQGADNRLINIEEVSEKEILELRKSYQTLASELHNSDQNSTASIKVADSRAG